MKVGFIGLGAMGLPMAKRVIAAGHETFTMVPPARFEPGFRLDLMKKDVNLSLASALALNVPLLLGSLVGQLFAAASASGKGDADFAAAAAHVAGMAGVRLDETMQPGATGEPVLRFAWRTSMSFLANRRTGQGQGDPTQRT